MFGRKKKIAPCNGNDRISELVNRSCSIKVKSLSEEAIQEYSGMISSEWQIRSNKITRVYSLDNYMHMIDLVNKIAKISEKEDHHPVMRLYYCRLEIEIYTFSLDCLSENDFILASKIDREVCCR